MSETTQRELDTQASLWPEVNTEYSNAQLTRFVGSTLIGAGVLLGLASIENSNIGNVLGGAAGVATGMGIATLAWSSSFDRRAIMLEAEQLARDRITVAPTDISLPPQV